MKKYKEVNFSKVKKDYQQSSDVGQAVTGAIALPAAVAGAIGLGAGIDAAKAYTSVNAGRTAAGLNNTVAVLNNELSSHALQLNNNLGAISSRLRTAGETATRDEKIILSTILGENKKALDNAVAELAAIKGEGDVVVRRLRAASQRAKSNASISTGSKLSGANLSKSIDELLAYKNEVLKEISKDPKIYNNFKSTISHGLSSAIHSIPESAKLAVTNLVGTGHLFANSARHMGEVGRAAGTATGNVLSYGLKGAGSIGKAEAKVGLNVAGGLLRGIIGTPIAAAAGTVKGAGRFLSASPTRTAALMATGAGLGIANSIIKNRDIKRGYMIKNDQIGKLQGSYRTPLQGGKYYVTFEDARTGTAKVVAGANSRAEAREMLVSHNLVTSDRNIDIKIHIGKALANLYPRQFYAV